MLDWTSALNVNIKVLFWLIEKSFLFFAPPAAELH